MESFMSAEIIKCSQCCSTENLQNKLNDLNLKYEALEQKYKTTKLENKEYTKQIDELSEQNQELKHALESNKKRMTEQFQQLSPILELHKSSINLVVEEQSQIDELEHKLKRYQKAMQLLKSENINIRKDNEKFRTVLELNNKQKQMQKIMLIAKNKTIESLQNQVHLLQDELQTVETVQYVSPKTSIITPTANCDHLDISFPDTRIPADSVQALYFTKTIDNSDDPLQLASVFGNSISSTASVQFASMDADNKSCLDSIHENNNMDKLQLKLENLMTENQELIEQINILEDNKDCMVDVELDEKCDSGEVIFEEEDLGFDDDDMLEMEQLFRKCDLEMMRSGHDVFGHHSRTTSLSWWSSLESNNMFQTMGK